MNEDKWIISGIVAFILFFFSVGYGLYYLDSIESAKWEIFKKENNCQEISHKAAQTVNTFAVNANGNPIVGISTIPEQTGYICNNGITYYK